MKKSIAEQRFKVGDIVRYSQAAIDVHKSLYTERDRMLGVPEVSAYMLADYVVTGFIPSCERVEVDTFPRTGTYGSLYEDELVPTGREDHSAVGPPEPRICAKCGEQICAWARRYCGCPSTNLRTMR